MKGLTMLRATALAIFVHAGDLKQLSLNELRMVIVAVG